MIEIEIKMILFHFYLTLNVRAALQRPNNILQSATVRQSEFRQCSLLLILQEHKNRSVDSNGVCIEDVDDTQK